MTCDPYPEIGELLASYADGAWARLVFAIVLGDDWSQTEFYQLTERDKRCDLDLTDDDFERIEDLFHELRWVTREAVDPGQPDWTTAKFTVRRDGHFDVDFGYDPLP